MSHSKGAECQGTKCPGVGLRRPGPPAHNAGMRVLRALVLGILLLGFTPGLLEWVHDAAHFALEGHSAHAAEHVEHEGADPEHSCTGWHHTCPCHSSASFVPVEPLAVLAAAVSTRPMEPPTVDLGPDGVGPSIDRPPRG